MTDVRRVDVYRHCPRCAGARVEVRAPRIDCADCGLSIYVNVAGAVAGIVIDAAERVLLIRRAHEPARGKLAFPGGFVDPGETAEAALLRELREEVGVEVDCVEYLCSGTNLYPFGGFTYPTLDLFFVVRVPSLEAARALDEVSAVEIVSVSELRPDALAFDSMRAAWAEFLRVRGALGAIIRG